MESLISKWDAIGILCDLTKFKLVVIETKVVVETTLALYNYRRACDCGQCALFLSVARGKVQNKRFFLEWIQLACKIWRRYIGLDSRSMLPSSSSAHGGASSSQGVTQRRRVFKHRIGSLTFCWCKAFIVDESKANQLCNLVIVTFYCIGECKIPKAQPKP
jgi:hypothetical protein